MFTAIYFPFVLICSSCVIFGTTMYTIRTPFFLRRLYPSLIWRMPRDQKRIFLTFDDGPIPDVTPWVLNTLKRYGIKATFFCVGANIEKNPDIFKRMLDEGHQVANHTYNHISGWQHGIDTYLENVERCEHLTGSLLFRPPYGRGKRNQYKALKKRGYRIVMWDVLSGDFDMKLSNEKCLNGVLKYTRNGSIIVFHDNIKAVPRLEYALPRAIEYWLSAGYEFGLL